VLWAEKNKSTLLYPFSLSPL